MLAVMARVLVVAILFAIYVTIVMYSYCYCERLFAKFTVFFGCHCGKVVTKFL